MANGIVQKNRERNKSEAGRRGTTRRAGELYRRGYNFVVFLEGKMIPFRRISGLEQSTGTETLREGGRNGVVYSLIQPVQEERVLTLEKGLLEEEGEFSQYQPGYQMRKETEIFVLGEGGKAVKSYFMRGCMIRKASLSELDAENSGLMSLTVELIYRTLEDDGQNTSMDWRL